MIIRHLLFIFLNTPAVRSSGIRPEFIGTKLDTSGTDFGQFSVYFSLPSPNVCLLLLVLGYCIFLLLKPRVSDLSSSGPDLHQMGQRSVKMSYRCWTGYYYKLYFAIYSLLILCFSSFLIQKLRIQFFFKSLHCKLGSKENC